MHDDDMRRFDMYSKTRRSQNKSHSGENYKKALEQKIRKKVQTPNSNEDSMVGRIYGFVEQLSFLPGVEQ